MLNDKTVRGTNFACVHAGPKDRAGLGLPVAVLAAKAGAGQL